MDHPILLVDDEADVRDSLGGALRRAGFDALCAASAEEALPLLHRAPLGCLVTDLVMPGAGGLALVRQARARYPELAVVVMTARRDLESTVECMRRGVFEYLVKPFPTEDLREAVRRGCEWTRAHGG